MREINRDNKKLYQCDACKLKYLEKEWAQKCELWCKEHHSCNLEIIEHAEKKVN